MRKACDMILTGGLCFFADFLTFIAVVGLEHPIAAGQSDGRFDDDVGVWCGGGSVEEQANESGTTVGKTTLPARPSYQIANAKYLTSYQPRSIAACLALKILT